MRRTNRSLNEPIHDGAEYPALGGLCCARDLALSGSSIVQEINHGIVVKSVADVLYTLFRRQSQEVFLGRGEKVIHRTKHERQPSGYRGLPPQTYKKVLDVGSTSAGFWSNGWP
jgi:hypothetical protein